MVLKKTVMQMLEDKIPVKKRVTRTQQQYREQADVNVIMAQYLKTGVLNHVAQRQGIYADLSDLPNYQTCLNIVKSAEAGFMSLDAKIRARFHNNPQELIKFLSKEKNRDEAVELGLVLKKDQPLSKIDLPDPNSNSPTPSKP